MRGSGYDSIEHRSGVVFISGDHHFLPDEDAPSLKRLYELTTPGDIVVFLGDLFEVWYENKLGHIGGYDNTLDLIQQMSEKGVSTHMVLGNRDFMADKKLEHRSGMTLHQKPLLIQSSESSLLAIHGDELLPDDQSYQLFKRFSRHPLTLAILHLLPLGLLAALSKKVRQKSKKKTTSLIENRYKPTITAIRHLIRLCRSRQIIAGHLHKDLSLSAEVDNVSVSCIIMPDSHVHKINYRTWDGSKLSELKNVTSE